MVQGIGLLVATLLSTFTLLPAHPAHLLTLLEGRRGSRALTTTNNSRRHGSKGEKCRTVQTMYDDNGDKVQRKSKSD